MATEEEIQRFVSQNRELIESIMSLQREGAVQAVSATRDFVKEGASQFEEAAGAARSQAEEFARSVYGMFMDPEVQRHFMTMGMEFMLGVSAMMQRAPIPDFVKDSASSTERSFRTTACRTNADCGARRAEKVEIVSDEGPEEIRINQDGE